MVRSKRDEQRAVLDLEERIKSIRSQLSDQQKVIEEQTSHRETLLADIREYYRKRSDLEAEYAKQLAKLSDEFIRKTNKRFHRPRDSVRLRSNSISESASAIFTADTNPDNFPASLHSIYSAWTGILGLQKEQAKEHERLHITAQNACTNTIQQVSDSLLVVVKRSRDIFNKVQRGLNQDLKMLNNSLQVAIDHKNKVQSASNKYSSNVVSNGAKTASANVRAVKLKERKHQKLKEASVAAYKAQNNYIFQLVSVNAGTEQYFENSVQEITDAFGLVLVVLRCQKVFEQITFTVPGHNQSRRTIPLMP